MIAGGVTVLAYKIIITPGVCVLGVRGGGVHLISTSSDRMTIYYRNLTNIIILVKPYWFLDAASQVDDGHVLDRNAEGHSGKLSVEGRNDLPDGLGCAGGRRDAVLSGRATAAPVFLARSVDGLLCSGVRVNRGHQGLDDVVLFVDNFRQRSQAVRGTGGITE